MKAAVVVEAGKTPVYGEFKEPAAEAGKTIVRVTASAITQLARARAAGTHYSSHADVPFIPGVDGVGVREDGKRVYFMLPQAPFGAMAEYSIVENRNLFEIPDGLRDETAAAMAITGMSSWAALMERAQFRAGETVLINGATGSSGRMAIQIAKHLGAKKIIATGRQTKMFDELRALGTDVVVPLIEDRDALELTFKAEFEKGVDVVLDYLWGPSAEAILNAAGNASPEGTAVRFVQIGTISGANIQLPGAILRSSGLVLMGSGVGGVPLPKLLKSIQGVLEAAPAAGFTIATQPVPLANVTEAWESGNADGRIVLIP